MLIADKGVPPLEAVAPLIHFLIIKKIGQILVLYEASEPLNILHAFIPDRNFSR